MAAITFDRLKFVDQLKHSGVSEKQARAFSKAFSDAHLEMDLATKQDLRELENRLTSKLTMRFGGMLTVAVTILAILPKIL